MNFNKFYENMQEISLKKWFLTKAGKSRKNHIVPK